MDKDVPPTMNDELSLDTPLVDTALHQALLVSDRVDPLEVLEALFAAGREDLDLARVRVILHVVDKVRPEGSDLHGEDGDWVGRKGGQSSVGKS